MLKRLLNLSRHCLKFLKKSHCASNSLLMCSQNFFLGLFSGSDSKIPLFSIITLINWTSSSSTHVCLFPLHLLALANPARVRTVSSFSVCSSCCWATFMCGTESEDNWGVNCSCSTNDNSSESISVSAFKCGEIIHWTSSYKRTQHSITEQLKSINYSWKKRSWINSYHLANAERGVRRRFFFFHFIFFFFLFIIFPSFVFTCRCFSSFPSIAQYEQICFVETNWTLA